MVTYIIQEGMSSPPPSLNVFATDSSYQSKEHVNPSKALQLLGSFVMIMINFNPNLKPQSSGKYELSQFLVDAGFHFLWEWNTQVKWRTFDSVWLHPIRVPTLLILWSWNWLLMTMIHCMRPNLTALKDHGFSTGLMLVVCRHQSSWGFFICPRLITSYGCWVSKNNVSVST